MTHGGDVDHHYQHCHHLAVFAAFLDLHLCGVFSLFGFLFLFLFLLSALPLSPGHS